MKKVKIYQLPIENDMVFAHYHKDLFDKNKDAYKCVYEYEVPDDYDFENVFTQLNISHPDGYNARSLSISDLVVMDNKTMYVDWVGFQDVNINN